MALGGGQATRRGSCTIFAKKFNKKRLQEEARQPGRHISSDVSRNSISNCHRRKHGSHDKPLPCIFIRIQNETTGESKAAKTCYRIIVELKFNEQRTREEARQPGNDAASYLQRDNTKPSHEGTPALPYPITMILSAPIYPPTHNGIF